MCVYIIYMYISIHILSISLFRVKWKGYFQWIMYFLERASLTGHFKTLEVQGYIISPTSSADFNKWGGPQPVPSISLVNDLMTRPIDHRKVYIKLKTINGLVSQGKFTGLSPRFYGKIYDTMVSCSYIHHFIIKSISCTTKRLVDLKLAPTVSCPATIPPRSIAGQNHPTTSHISFKPMYINLINLTNYR